MEQVSTGGEFGVDIHFTQEELAALKAGFTQRRSPSCADAAVGYKLEQKLIGASEALDEAIRGGEEAFIRNILAEEGLAPGVNGAPELVTLPNGDQTTFYGDPDGGSWNGRSDVNMAGRDGYTYGIVVIGGTRVTGYVCHSSKSFKTDDDNLMALIGQEPELSVSERARRARV